MQRFNLLYKQKINSKGDLLDIYCPNMLTLWRAQTFETKEPDTLEWIRTFQENDVLYDIGANVGLYSLFAAREKGCQVVAFEPESQNYALLNKHIYINKLNHLIKALCIALSDKTGMDDLYLSNFLVGSALHNFGEEVDADNKKFISKYKQGSISFTLDDLISYGKLPRPTHIKIDVDGIEMKVIQGMLKTLQHASVKSVLLEINPNVVANKEIFGMLESLGFKYALELRIPTTSNYIFIRKT